MLRSQIYLPETPNGTDDNTSAFYLVVKGKYNGGASTYYRIDFYDRAAKGDDAGSEHEGYVKPSAENRYDILRNHAYVINILRVRGDGYPTEADAAASEPINMEVDVYSWDTGDGSMGNMVTDGQYKLALSSTQLRYHQDGTAQEVTVFTDFELKGDETLDKGWHLTMRKTDVTVNGQDYSGDVKVEIYRDGTWEELTKEDQGESYFWTDGLPHTQYKLRVGLSRFEENNAAGLMGAHTASAFHGRPHVSELGTGSGREEHAHAEPSAAEALLPEVPQEQAAGHRQELARGRHVLRGMDKGRPDLPHEPLRPAGRTRRRP